MTADRSSFQVEEMPTPCEATLAHTTVRGEKTAATSGLGAQAAASGKDVSTQTPPQAEVCVRPAHATTAKIYPHQRWCRNFVCPMRHQKTAHNPYRMTGTYLTFETHAVTGFAIAKPAEQATSQRDRTRADSTATMVIIVLVGCWLSCRHGGGATGRQGRPLGSQPPSRRPGGAGRRPCCLECDFVLNSLATKPYPGNTSTTHAAYSQHSVHAERSRRRQPEGCASPLLQHSLQPTNHAGAGSGQALVVPGRALVCTWQERKTRVPTHTVIGQTLAARQGRMRQQSRAGARPSTTSRPAATR